MGIPFSIMNYNVMLTEQIANIEELLEHTNVLVEQERVFFYV